MKRILFVLLILSNLSINAQNKVADKILEEGKLLFRLEKASWYATDNFLLNLFEKGDSVGGYVSYEGSDKKIYTVFFNSFDPNQVLVRYQFDFIPEAQPIQVDTINREPTKLELDLMALRQDAISQVYENTDDFFSFYENINFNFIPLITKKERRVFILSATQQSGFVILGNDYVLNYDKKNRLNSQSKIHQSILQFPFKSDVEDNQIEQTMHSHVNGDYISSTDICTLLLYRDFLEWNQHIVLSKNQVSIFNLEHETLFTMKREDWDKISLQEN